MQGFAHAASFRACIAGALLCSASAGVQATLIAGNDPAFGAASDGFNITRDTDSGLDWLDLSLTDSQSFNDVVLSGLTASWRRATLAEVMELYENAGLVHPDTGNVLVDFAVNLGSPSTLTDENVTQAEFVTIFRAAEALIELVGVSGGNDQDGYVSIGTVADVDPGSGLGANAVAVLDIFFSPFVTQPLDGCLGNMVSGCFPLAVGVFAPLAGSGIGDDGARGDTGHFLVRNIPQSVPEPASWLLLLGALVAGGRGRRRTARAR